MNVHSEESDAESGWESSLCDGGGKETVRVEVERSFFVEAVGLA